MALSPNNGTANGHPAASLRSLTAQRRLQTKLLKAARAGDEGARGRLLKDFGIRLELPTDRINGGQT